MEVGTHGNGGWGGISAWVYVIMVSHYLGAWEQCTARFRIYDNLGGGMMAVWQSQSQSQKQEQLGLISVVVLISSSTRISRFTRVEAGATVSPSSYRMVNPLSSAPGTSISQTPVQPVDYLTDDNQVRRRASLPPRPELTNHSITSSTPKKRATVHDS